jgi:PST family polysaccharide transporter
MASRRQAAHGAFWGLIERASTQGISFLVVLVLARLLGPENYGLVTLAATMALLGQTLLGETFSQALIQAKTVEPEHVSSIFWMLVVAGALSAIGLVLGAGLLASAFGEPALAPLVQALSPLLLLTSLQAVPMALFKRDLDFRSIAMASTSGTVLGGLIGIGMAVGGYGAWSLVANLLAQNGIITAVIWRRSRFHPLFRYSHVHFLALWSYGQFTFLLRIAAFMANQGPRMVVGYLFGPAELGAFSLGLRIIEIMYQLLTLPAANVAIPVIAKVRDDPARLSRAILGATQLAAMVSAPAYIGLALMAPLAIPIVFGARWSESVEIVQILAAYGVVGASILIWGSITGGLGRPDVNLRITSLAAVLSIVLLFATASWGLIGSSLVFVVRGYVILPLFPIYIKRITGIGIGAQFAVLAPVAGACAVMALVIVGVMRSADGIVAPLPLMLLTVAAAGLSYAGALYVFGRSAIRLGVSIISDLRPVARGA